ncbi:MAG: GC-type dockerin domain-anchored protein [Phycisphaerales bacterium]|nr:GC-type dockerin domain-anchored protein [Phycisphaerales bacterium]
MFFLLSGNANADVIFVDDEAIGANTGTTWSDAFNSLQNALDSASFGDEIWVTSSVYRPTRLIDRSNPIATTSDPRDATFWIPRGVQLFGGFSGTESSINQRSTIFEHTVLSGDIGIQQDHSDNSYCVVFYAAIHGGGYGGSDTDQTIPARIDGFEISNANADIETGAGVYTQTGQIGNAVYNTRLNIANCVIANNSSVENGGGLYLGRWAGDMINCEVRENYSGNNGGGMFLQQIGGSRSIINTVFAENVSANNGGGLCRTGDGPTPPFAGAYPLYILNCTFTKNIASARGGGLSYRSNISGSITFPLAVANSEFTSNTAGTNGGGLYLWEGFDLNPGIIHGSIGDVRSSTFGDNVATGFGGGLYAGVGSNNSITADLSVANSILWGNSASEDDQANIEIGIISSCIQDGGWPSVGNIISDPLFYNPKMGDYSLTNGSPAADSGWNVMLPQDVLDLDSDLDFSELLPVDLRFQSRMIDAGVPDTGVGTNSITDMGAYELCSGDFNRDGDLNFLDISKFLSSFGSNDSDADINGDESINFLDISAFLASFQSGCNSPG